MKPPVDTVRISQRGRDILLNLRRKTGIENWNVLCRWAFAISLANRTPPVEKLTSGDSNVEMSWETFAGENKNAYLSAFYFRANQDNVPIDRNSRASYFRTHLERGISQLQVVKSLPDLLQRSVKNKI